MKFLSPSKYIRRVPHFLRLRGPLANDLRSQILHALLLTVIVWLAFWTVVLMPFYPMNGPNPLAILALEVSLATALLLLRLGKFRGATLVYLAGTWLWATLVVALNGGIRSPGLVLYVTLPISAAWLLGFPGALWTAGVCMGCGLGFAILEITGVNIPRLIPGTPLGIWTVLVQAVLIGSVPISQVLRALRDALVQSRKGEEELQAYKEHLELLVDERTAELVQARDQAQAANKAKSAFLTNMSHELRTPLNAILGFSNLMRQHDATENQRRDLDIISRSGEHLLSLINDVLDVAKIEAGQRVIEVAPCDLKKVLHEVTDMMRSRAEGKLLRLRLVEAPESPDYVWADAARLRQVLINLLGNAIKYTDQGSVTLRVDARPVEDSRHVGLIFEVEDTGIGIAAEDQARIFEAFVQIAGARKQKGTGLGLAITKQFIELMGGTIQVRSTLGQGSCFRIEIPVEQVMESEVKTPKAEREQIIGLEAGQPEYRVLIVDDERENWMLLQRLLQGAGFQVRVAQDGALGVESFQEWRPHFIWMDLRMPLMNGFDASRRIRELEGGREVKIAAVTASGFADQRSAALAAGMDDYVRKPYRPSEIFECMARHLTLRYRHKVAPGAVEPPPELRPEDFAGLPEDLRVELREALVALDVERISAAIDGVSQENGPLGLALARCANRYAYTTMLNAIEPEKIQSARGTG